jgi:two-component system chemotaxis response regulator CheB
MDGLEATRQIMYATPTPIVLISAHLNTQETNIAFEAISAGAVSVMKKPGLTQSLSYQDSVKEFLNTLRAMSSVRVIRHSRSSRAPVQTPADSFIQNPLSEHEQPEIVAIVASTGGPHTISEIVKHLPSTFTAPVVIVQHITPDFVAPLVEWMGTVSALPVRVAQPGERPLPGTIYFAPGKFHLRMNRSHRFELNDTPPDVPHIPSGDVFLESIAQHYGPRAVGVVLTGMGNDGALGLRAMYEAGAVTVAQDEATSVVFGMPQEAIALGAVCRTLAPSAISELLITMVQE